MKIKLLYCAVVLQLLICLGQCGVAKRNRKPDGTCEKLRSSICMDIDYNQTFIEIYSSQADKENQMQSVLPLIKSGCSEYTKEFTCSTIFPQCTKSNKRGILPCRSMCERVKNDCRNSMKAFGVFWEDTFNCQDFPTKKCRAIRSQGGKNVVSSFPDHTCVPLDSPFCTKVKYNFTLFPNEHFATQEYADLEIHQYFPLIKLECSDVLQEFLCRTYFPECTEIQDKVLPCRSICEEAKRGCVGIMRSFGFDWPENLSCENYPETNCPGLKDALTTVLPETVAVTSPTPVCQPMLTSVCTKVDYNYTMFPTSRFDSQHNAVLEMNQFYPIIQSGCSDVLEEFLCYTYFPVCTVLQKEVPSCRSLCEKAKRGCSNVISEFGFHWPEHLSCENFPESNCIGEKIVEATTSVSLTIQTNSETLVGLAKSEAKSITEIINRIEDYINEMNQQENNASSQPVNAILFAGLQSSITGLKSNAKVLSTFLSAIENLEG